MNIKNNDVTAEELEKYNIAGPRYTSYPTAPEWKDKITQDDYKTILQNFSQTNESLSLYIHIPFCRSLCWFCGCNVKIRQKSSHADLYLDYLEKEINLIVQSTGKHRDVYQLHLGGGTPNFLEKAQFDKLFNILRKNFNLNLQSEISIEIDPRTVTEDKLKHLRKIGFNRISMGIQDFNPIVQKAINRIQPFSLVKKHFQTCKNLGFDSINFDLIYGLPFQNIKTFSDTVKKVCALGPDRIALYSYAYLPSKKPQMKLISPDDLPDTATKFNIFLKAKHLFNHSGYTSIALDHFAKKSDQMAKTFKEGKLHRNFMGYTLKPAEQFIGLGVTSISNIQNAFIQNADNLEDYYKILDKDSLPVHKGKILNCDDVMRQWVINSLMCTLALNKQEFFKIFQNHFDIYFSEVTSHLNWCVKEGFINLSKDTIKVTNKGALFVRNICMGFDHYLKSDNGFKGFSKTV